MFRWTSSTLRFARAGAVFSASRDAGGLDAVIARLAPLAPSQLCRSGESLRDNGGGEPGYFHIEIAEVQTEEGKLYMFVAVDRTSKFAYAGLHPRATRVIAKDFLDNLTKAAPYKIHTILTDNGIQFAKREGTEAYWAIPFDRLCDAPGAEHRLTKLNHPWTNGQVERANRTLEATVKRALSD
jgi:hypothetical protein